MYYWYYVIVANFIDGAALAVLPDDFVEFSHLLPKSGLRIKLKAAIEKRDNSFEQFSVKVRQYEYAIVLCL